MENATLWWILAASLVAIELATGTVYFLSFAAGAAAGALASYFGVSGFGQMVIAAAVGAAATLAWHKLKPAKNNTEAKANDAVQQDIGARITVDAWQGLTARVSYRGANWQARTAEGYGNPQAGAHTVVAVEGNVLILQAA